jgi:hypothetical protein
MATATNRLTCCPSCRLRFPPIAAAYLTACPECGAIPTTVDRPGSLLGFRLLDPVDVPYTLPEAISVSLPAPQHGSARRTDPDS